MSPKPIDEFVQYLCAEKPHPIPRVIAHPLFPKSTAFPGAKDKLYEKGEKKGGKGTPKKPKVVSKDAEAANNLFLLYPN